MHTTANRQANKQAEATDLRQLEALVDGVIARGGRSPSLTAEKLKKEFGYGDQPRLTRRLYERLERGCDEHGPKYEKIVRDCARAARSADRPAAYFAVAVSRRLRESGFPQ